MIVIDENSSFKCNYETFIALGSFDGLHLGHMSLINKAIELAKERGIKSMVYTFKNHPLTVVNKEISPKLLMDNSTKTEILKDAGIDITCLVEFNKEFMQMSPEDFIKHLKSVYKMQGVVVGFNYRFGYKNSGDVNLLKLLSKQYDYEICVIDPLGFDGEVVSSSKIRKFIQEGDIIEANKLLCRPFSISGPVVSGRKIGRQLGFPTANVPINENLIYPKVGVYYTNVVVDGEIYKGITNIGYNPTVNGTTLSFETNILDFASDIYGKTITVYFIERIRSELKFNSRTDLINQMESDKEYARSKKIELINKK